MKTWLRSLGSIALAGTLLLSTGCADNTPKTYTVVFKQVGYTDMIFTVNAGGELKNPPKPKVVTGYSVEWDRTQFENITQDIVVNAIATPNEYLITYAVAQDETLVGEYTQTVVYDSQYELKTPTKYGYLFDSWYNGNAPVATSGVWNIANNVNLTAKWSDNSYTLTFIHYDGTREERWLEKGDVLSATDVPTVQELSGYETYWSVDDFSNISTNTTITTQKSAKTFAIEYLLDDGETLDAGAPTSVRFGDAYTLIAPTKAGTNFRYWETLDGVKVPLTGNKWNIPQNVQLQAVWTEKVVITFMHNDGTTDEVEAQTGGSLTADQIPTPKPVPGYDVVWAVTDFSCIEGAMTVETCLLPKTFEVSYSVPEDENLHGTLINVEYHGEYALATPVRYGYSFVAWKTPEGVLIAPEGNEWPIVGNVVLTAEWQNNYYEITFVHADNTTTVVMVENGDTLSADRVPACKQIPGYTVRWEDKDFSTITSGTTVQALKEAKSYQVTYQLEAGESISGENPLTVTYGKSYQLPTPKSTDSNLYFAGWKNAATGEKVAMSGTWKIASDVVLVADWVKESDWTNNH